MLTLIHLTRNVFELLWVDWAVREVGVWWLCIAWYLLYPYRGYVLVPSDSRDVLPMEHPMAQAWTCLYCLSGSLLPAMFLWNLVTWRPDTLWALFYLFAWFPVSLGTHVLCCGPMLDEPPPSAPQGCTGAGGGSTRPQAPGSSRTASGAGGTSPPRQSQVGGGAVGSQGHKPHMRPEGQQPRMQSEGQRARMQGTHRTHASPRPPSRGGCGMGVGVGGPASRSLATAQEDLLEEALQEALLSGPL